MTTVPANLVRLRWAVRAVLALGVAASTVANVLHAPDNPISQAIAAWPPLALLLTVELLSRVPVHRRGLAAVRLAAAGAIAGIAAWVSYWHMADVAARYGETGGSQYLLPLSVDGLVVVASICLVELGGRIRTAADEPARPAASVQATAEPSPSTARPSAPVRRPARPAPTAKPRRNGVRPPADLAVVREVFKDRPIPGRDAFVAAVRSAGYSIANERARELLRELRAA